MFVSTLDVAPVASRNRTPQVLSVLSTLQSVNSLMEESVKYPAAIPIPSL
jgi:uncharacterized protein (DUF2249 family)